MKTKMISRLMILVGLLAVQAQAQLLGPIVRPGDGVAGVGIALNVEEEAISVSKVMENTPAAASKQIHEGDRIIAVGQEEEPAQSLAGKTLPDAVAMIRGQVGSQVRLTVVPKGAPTSAAREVMLTRDEIMNPLGLAVDAPLLEAGAQAPDLRYVRLGDGQATTLAAEHKDKIVVLEFWATWCAPCQQTVAELEKIAAGLTNKKDRIVFLSISIDGTAVAKPPEMLQKVRAHVKQKNWTQTLQGWAPLEGRSNWHVRAVPALYLIGANGKIIAADPGTEKLAELLSSLAK